MSQKVLTPMMKFLLTGWKKREKLIGQLGVIIITKRLGCYAFIDTYLKQVSKKRKKLSLGESSAVS